VQQWRVGMEKGSSVYEYSSKAPGLTFQRLPCLSFAEEGVRQATTDSITSLAPHQITFSALAELLFGNYYIYFSLTYFSSEPPQSVCCLGAGSCRIQ